MALPLTPPAQIRPRGQAAAHNPLPQLTMAVPGVRYQTLSALGYGDQFKDELKAEQQTDSIVSDLAVRQARENEKREAERRSQQQKDLNATAESQYRAQNRPIYTDPHGNIKPQQDDATFQRNRELEAKYRAEGRPYWNDAGVVRPEDDDEAWERKQAAKKAKAATTRAKSEASQEAALHGAAISGLGKTLTDKELEELTNTVTSQRSSLDQAAREHARLKLEETPEFKATSPNWWIDPDDSALTEEQRKARQRHRLLADPESPLPNETLEEVRQRYLQDQPDLHKDFLAKDAELKADKEKREKLSLLSTKEQRARAIAAGNSPEEVEAILPRTTQELKAELDQDHARLKDLRTRNAAGVAGPEALAAQEEDRLLVERIQSNSRFHAQARQREAQAAIVTQNQAKAAEEAALEKLPGGGQAVAKLREVDETLEAVLERTRDAPEPVRQAAIEEHARQRQAIVAQTAASAPPEAQSRLKSGLSEAARAFLKVFTGTAAGMARSPESLMTPQGLIKQGLDAVASGLSAEYAFLLGMSDAQLDSIDPNLRALVRPGDTLAKGIEGADAAIDRALPTNPEYQGEWGAQKIPNVLGQAAGQLGTLVIPGGVASRVGGVASKALAPALTATGLAQASLMGSNAGLKEAERIGVQSPLKRQIVAAIFGGTEAATEAIAGFGNPSFSKALAGEIRDLLTGSAGKTLLKTAGGEALEEGAAKIPQDVTSTSFRENDAEVSTINPTKLDFWASLAEDMALGGIAGLAFGGVQAVADRRTPAAAMAMRVAVRTHQEELAARQTEGQPLAPEEVKEAAELAAYDQRLSQWLAGRGVDAAQQEAKLVEAIPRLSALSQEAQAVQKAAAIAASDSELSVYAPPAPTGDAQVDSMAALAPARARVLRDVSQGRTLSDFQNDELQAIGLERTNTGEVKPAKGKGAMPAAVSIENGNPIILQPVLDQMQQTFPQTRALVGMSEREARAKFAQAQAAGPSAGMSGNAPATGGANPVVPAQGAAAAPPAGAAPAFAPNADGTASAEFPSDQAARDWVQANRGELVMAKLTNSNGKSVVTIRPKARSTAGAPSTSTGSPAPTPQSPPAAPAGSATTSVQAPATSPPDGSRTPATWSAKGKAGTPVAIPASAASSPQEALEALAVQLPDGEAVEPTSLIPPRQTQQPAVSQKAKTVPQTAQPVSQASASVSPAPEGVSKVQYRPVLELAIQADVPVSHHKKAATVAEHLTPLLETFAGVFPGLRITTLKSGSGLSVAEDGTLLVDVDRLTSSMPDQSSGDWIKAAFREELIHLCAMRVIPREQAEAFWLDLYDSDGGPELQQTVLRGYLAAFEARGEAIPAADQVDAWAMTHEFIRMMVQDKAFAQQVTEAMEVNPTLAATLREFLQNIVNYLRKAFAALPEELQAEARAMEQSVIAQLNSLGVPLESEIKAPASAEKGEELQSEASVVQQTAPSAPAAGNPATAKPEAKKRAKAKVATKAEAVTITPTLVAAETGEVADTPAQAVAKVGEEVRDVAKTEGPRDAAEVKRELVMRLEKAIVDAAANPGGNVTIQIPGDGTFKISNNEKDLKTVLARVQRMKPAPGPTVAAKAKNTLDAPPKNWALEWGTKESMDQALDDLRSFMEAHREQVLAAPDVAVPANLLQEHTGGSTFPHGRRNSDYDRSLAEAVKAMRASTTAKDVPTWSGLHQWLLMRARQATRAAQVEWMPEAADKPVLSAAERPQASPADFSGLTPAALRTLQPVYRVAENDLGSTDVVAITPRAGQSLNSRESTEQWLEDTIGTITSDTPAHFRCGQNFHGRLSKESPRAQKVPHGTTYLELVHEENPGHALIEMPVKSGAECYAALLSLPQTLRRDSAALGERIASADQEAAQASKDGALSPAARLAQASELMKGATTHARRAIVDAARTFEPALGLSYLATARAAASSTLQGVDVDANAAATSPLNDVPQPTDGQKQATNYQLGHTTVGGLAISIENPAGSTRSGADPSGKPWSVTMKSHYGYLRGTQGKDGDHIDCFIKVGTPHDYNGPVFVVNQTKADGSFDEHKAVIGVSTPEEARAEYLQNYSPGWKGLGSLAVFPSTEAFGKWATARRRIAEAKGLQSAERAAGKPLESIAGKSAAEIFASAKKRHGITSDIDEAGYVLPDGAMLDFTGRADAGYVRGNDNRFRPKPGERDFMRHERGVDHREVEWEGQPKYKETWEPMVDFMRLGAIRMDKSGAISMHGRFMPTAAQQRVLRDLVTTADGASLDLEDDSGERASIVVHGPKWGKMLGFVRRWAEGETPEDPDTVTSLFAAERPGMDPDLRAGLDLLAEAMPPAELREVARQSGSWFEDSIEYDSEDAQAVRQQGLVDMAYHQRRVSQTHEEWNTKARAAIESDREAVLKELVSDVLDHGAITNPTKIKAAQMLMPDMFRQAVMTGDRQALRDAEALCWGYDIAGTETARSLAARWQPHKSPAEANREMLAKMIFCPPPAQRADVERCLTPAQKAKRIADLELALSKANADLQTARAQFSQLQQDKTVTQTQRAAAESRARAANAEIAALQKQLAAAKAAKDRFERLAQINGERLARIEEELGNLGITLHDLFVSKEVIVRLRGDVLVKRALEKFTDLERRCIKLMFDGRSDRQIANELGMPRATVNGLQEKAEAAMLEVFTGWTKRGFSLADMETLDAAGNRVDLSQVMNDDGTLKAAARPVTVSDADALLKAKEMLRAMLPTAKARNTGALKRFTGDTKASPFGFDPAKPYHAVAVARLIQSIDNTKGDQLYEFWINGLLSGPATHVANIAGNTANAALEYGLQRSLEATANLFLNDPSLATFGEFVAMKRGACRAFTDALRAMRHAWKTEADLFESEWLNKPVEYGHGPDKAGGARYSIPGATGRFIRIPCRALLAMDAFFKHLIGRLEASAQAYRIARSEGRTGADLDARIKGLVGTPGSAAWVIAVRQAKDLTFQTELPTYLKTLERVKNERSSSTGGAIVRTLLRFIFPFIRTPWNIFATGLRKTPLGTFNMLARSGTAAFGMRGGRPFIESYPKAMLLKHAVEQCIAWTGFAMLYGIAEGDPDDDKKWLLITGTRSPDDRAGEKKMLERARGGQTMVVINGQPVFNYGRIEPFATIVTTTVDALREIKKVGRGARASDMAAAVLGNIKDQTDNKTFFQGLDTLYTAVDQLRDPDKAAKKLGEAVIKGVVPNIIRQPLRNIDEHARDTRNAPLIYSAFPLGGLAEPLYDLYGRPVEKTGNPLSRLFFASGTQPAPEHVGDTALSRWNATHPLETYYPGPDLISRYKDTAGKWVDMTPEEMALQRREGGQNMGRKVAATVSAAEAMAPTTKTVEKIESARRSSFTETRNRMFQGGNRPFIPKRPVSLAEMMGMK